MGEGAAPPRDAPAFTAVAVSFREADSDTGTPAVPGADIHYEMRGSGPILPLVNGGDGDAAIFGPPAALLTEHYRVAGFAKAPHSVLGYRSPTSWRSSQLLTQEGPFAEIGCFPAEIDP